RLAGAVVAEEAEDRAGRGLEVEVAHRPVLAEALAEPGGGDADRSLVRDLEDRFRGVYHCFVHRTTTILVRCTKRQGVTSDVRPGSRWQTVTAGATVVAGGHPDRPVADGDTGAPTRRRSSPAPPTA